MTKPDHGAYRSSLDFLFAEEKDEMELKTKYNHCFKCREETWVMKSEK